MATRIKAHARQIINSMHKGLCSFVRIHVLLDYFKVFFFDMTIDKEGWNVIQKRKDRSVDFNHDWIGYVCGFGTEFFLGLNNIQELKLLADMEDRGDAKYGTVGIGVTMHRDTY